MKCRIKAGIMFVREGGTLLTRQLNGAQLYLRVHRYAQDVLAGVQWGIIRTREGEFLVPDAPFHATDDERPRRTTPA
jgi:hypothetical protein